MGKEVESDIWVVELHLRRLGYPETHRETELFNGSKEETLKIYKKLKAKKYE